MTVKQIIPGHYEMDSGDSKPTSGILPTTTIREKDTNLIWITYDGGSTWIIADKRVRLVEEDGTFIDLPGELDAIVTAVEAVTAALAALGYAFTIEGINFNDYTKIKTLWLPSEATSSAKVNFQVDSSDYVVPGSHVFIAIRFTGCIEGVDTVARIGEGASGDDITKDVLSLGVGTGKPFMENVLGVFAATKYIKARTDHGSNGLKANSALYGIEVSTG